MRLPATAQGTGPWRQEHQKLEAGWALAALHPFINVGSSPTAGFQMTPERKDAGPPVGILPARPLRVRPHLLTQHAGR